MPVDLERIAAQNALKPATRAPVRDIVYEMLDALMAGDRDTARRTGRKLKCVGVSPEARRSAFAEWRAAHPDALPGFFAAYDAATAPPEQTYCPTLRWSPQAQMLQQALAARPWWKTL